MTSPNGMYGSSLPLTSLPERRGLQTDGPPLRVNWQSGCVGTTVRYRGYTGGIGIVNELPEPVNLRYCLHGLQKPEGTGIRYQQIKRYPGATRAPPGVPFNESQLAALWGPQLVTHPAAVASHPQQLSQLPGRFDYGK